ncbi:MAG: energy transducer TonB [Acidobacteriota bacterium]|nr:energy transducer TonB [Acidobacteriota bacterium]
MKFCPTCQTRYDEEILLFCTKDGTPLVEENQPVFTELPSESIEDDFSEETVIRRNKPNSEPDSEPLQPVSSPRIVIPTNEPVKETLPPPVRPRVVTEYQIHPRKTNTAKIVLLTLLGTFAILGGVGALLLMSRGSNNNDNTNQNIGVNTNFGSLDTNLNTNLNISNSLANFNGGINISNANLNTNLSTNINVNIKTPTPKPTPTPSATPPPILNSNINISNSNANSTPTPANTRQSATPTLPSPPPPSPKSSPSDTPPSNRPVNAGVLNGRAINMPKPAYPPIAKQMRASGQVAVQIVIDEAGNVTSAKATSGNILLRAPAEAAARQSKINPIKIGDVPVQAVGILLYNFSNQ